MNSLKPPRPPGVCQSQDPATVYADPFARRSFAVSAGRSDAGRPAPRKEPHSPCFRSVRSEPVLNSHNFRRPGFTLMETLVALGVLCTLTASMALSIELYWKHREASRRQLLSSAVVRGILEDLTVDLRSAVIPHRILSEDDPPDARHVREPEIHERVLSIPNQTTTPVHFVGTENWLAVTAHTSNPRFPETQRSLHPDTANGFQIVWQVDNGDSASLPLMENAAGAVPVKIPSAGFRSCIVRTVRGLEKRDPAEAEGHVAHSLIHGDSAQLRFRYSDGHNWLAAWDTRERMQLPRAVECTIRFQQRNAEFSFVVSLPH